MKDNFSKIKKLSTQIKKDILKMAYFAKANSSHIGGSLSTVDILSVLFASIINIDKKKIYNKDRFFLSKGHACLGYYAILKYLGYIKDKDLETFEKKESILLGHPVKNAINGIELSSGSLGTCLSIAVGIAIAYKKKNKKNNIYVIIGDGECNEGSIWEAAMCSSHYNLDNLVVILDNNKFQQTGSNKLILNTSSLEDKWNSFGWNVVNADGHNHKNLLDSFNSKKIKNKPKIIIANTIKGKGISFIEGNNDWHHSILTEKNYYEALNELK